MHEGSALTHNDMMSDWSLWNPVKNHTSNFKPPTKSGCCEPTGKSTNKHRNVTSCKEKCDLNKATMGNICKGDTSDRLKSTKMYIAAKSIETSMWLLPSKVFTDTTSNSRVPHGKTNKQPDQLVTEIWHDGYTVHDSLEAMMSQHHHVKGHTSYSNNSVHGQFVKNPFCQNSHSSHCGSPSLHMETWPQHFHTVWSRWYVVGYECAAPE